MASFTLSRVKVQPAKQGCVGDRISKMGREIDDHDLLVATEAPFRDWTVSACMRVIQSSWRSLT